MKREDIEKATLVQKYQVDNAKDSFQEKVEQADKISSTDSETFNQLSEIDRKMEELAQKAGIDRASLNIDNVESAVSLTDDELDSIEYSLPYYNKIETIPYNGWESYVSEVNGYIERHNLDVSIDPIAQMLTPEEYKAIDKKYKVQFEKYKWDKWDYTFVGSAGVIASLTDFLLVKIPKTITYGGVEQAGSPITDFLKKRINSEEGTKTWFSDWANELEKRCKVPYDNVAGSGLGGMTGRTHRLQTLGHDPILGLVFGVLNIMRGTITGFSYEKLAGLHKLKSIPVQGAENIGLIQAILKQLGHLVSDVGTKTGVQPPFFTLLQGINAQSPFSPKGRSVGEIARWMYLNGYDFRHFLTTGITPGVIEIILRAYIMIRHYSEHGEVKFMVASNPKYRSMLLAAHGIATVGNLGKVALQQGNPLAINYAQWIALFRYLLPSLKYWLFDKPKAIETFFDQRWEMLYTNSSNLYTPERIKSLDTIQLGI